MPERSPGARSSLILGTAAVVALAVLAGFVWVLTRSDDSADDVRSSATPTTARPTTAPDANASTTAPATAEPPTTAPAAAPSPTAPASRRAGQPITLAFAGDTNGEGLSDADMAQAMAARLGPMRDILSSADLTVVNLETAITDRGTGAPKAFTFRAPPSILDGMQAAGVDVVSMANNHGMDFGTEGLQDTLAAKQTSPIPVIGIGANDAEAFAPARITVKDQRVAVIAATQVLDSNLISLWTATPDHPGLASAKRVDRLVSEVRSARADSDVVVVFLHWGIERSTCPSASQQELARTLADAGADVIVGGHAHRLQGGGYLGKAFVHYGLGNFGFRSLSPEAARTGVLTLTVDGRGVQSSTWHPGQIRDATPVPLSGEAAQQALDRWNSLRPCTGLTDAAS